MVTMAPGVDSPAGVSRQGSSLSVDLFEFRAKAEAVCGICGKELDKNRAEIDHIIPLSRGGGHVWGNLQLAHVSCNRRKGNALQEVVYSI